MAGMMIRDTDYVVPVALRRLGTVEDVAPGLFRRRTKRPTSPQVIQVMGNYSINDYDLDMAADALGQT
jgi:hypothetical protein